MGTIVLVVSPLDARAVRASHRRLILGRTHAVLLLFASLLLPPVVRADCHRRRSLLWWNAGKTSSPTPPPTTPSCPEGDYIEPSGGGGGCCYWTKKRQDECAPGYAPLRVDLLGDQGRAVSKECCRGPGFDACIELCPYIKSSFKMVKLFSLMGWNSMFSQDQKSHADFDYAHELGFRDPQCFLGCSLRSGGKQNTYVDHVDGSSGGYSHGLTHEVCYDVCDHGEADAAQIQFYKNPDILSDAFYSNCDGADGHLVDVVTMMLSQFPSPWEMLFGEGTAVEQCRRGCDLWDDVTCPKGEYLNHSVGLEGKVRKTEVRCEPCPPGHYSDRTGLFHSGQCKKCALGKYSLSTGAQSAETCVTCRSGRWSDRLGSGTGDDCHLCEEGTYNSETGATAKEHCLPCEAGRYQNEKGKAECKCKLCPAGRYLMKSGSSSDRECALCAKGKYGPLEGAKFEGACLACPLGTFNPAEGAPSEGNCVKCPSGKKGTSVALASSDECTTCPVGESSPEGSSSCSRCDPGTYGEGGVCRECRKGHYCFQGGEVVCPAGRYNDKLKSSLLEDCDLCPAGKFFENSGAVSDTYCEPCPSGRWGNVSGAKSLSLGCHDCAIGTYRPSSAATTTCLPCEIGKTTLAEGASSCTTCDPGKTLVGTSCAICPPGTFSRLGSTCVECSAGYHGMFSYEIRDRCDPCPAGTHGKGITGAASREECAPCPVGTYSSLQGIDAAGKCRSCPTGRIGEVEGSTSIIGCTPCLPGTYAAVSGLTTCSSCEKGTFSRRAQATCTLCGLGNVSFPNASHCEPCPGATYSDELSRSPRDCKKCDSGKIKRPDGLGCTVCERGWFSNANLTACEPCPAGRWGSSSGTGSVDAGCQRCLPGFEGNGKQSATSHEAACTECLPGTFSSKGTECSPCDGAGEYSPEHGSAYCLVATAAHKPNHNRTAEELCPKNTFSLGANDTCANCTNGFSKPGSVSCTLCAPGTRTDNELGQCVDCEEGRFSESGATCEPCKDGFYSDQKRATFCKSVGAGFKTSFTGALRTGKEPCPENTYSIGANDACVECSKTNEYSVPGSVSCTQCTAGRMLRESSIGCSLCEAGSIRQFHEESCHFCNEGTYANDDQTDCLPCDAGAHGKNKGQTNSTCSGLCPAGTYSTLYATSCTLCEIGKYNPEEGQEACLPCDPSHPTYLTSDVMGATNCVCLPGKYNSSDGKCVPCHDGMDCSEAGGDIATLKLKMGNWRPSALSDEVLACPVPKACLSNLTCVPGNEGVLCAICSEGFYRPSAFAVCESCGDETFAALSALGVLLAMVACIVLFIQINRRAPSGLLRPFINLVQQLTVMLMFDAPFPEALVDLYRVLAGMSLGIDVVSPQCAGVGSSFYVLFSLSLVALGAVILALMAGPILMIFRNASCLDIRSNLHEVIVSTEGARAFRDVFVVILLLHPTISGKAMEFFRCRSIDGVVYLMADYSLVCYDGAWFAYLSIVVLVLVLFSLGTPTVIAYVLYARRLTLYEEDGTPKPQPLDILYAIYRKEAYWYEIVQMVFKLALWSTLVFFEHGSEMQLAAALVVNVLQLCVHIEIKPMGGEDARLLNTMQTCTLVLTTYINFGALSMNYLQVSKELAQYTDPDGVGGYDGRIVAIGVVMEVLTFGLFLSFGGVVIKKAILGASATRDCLRLRSRGDSAGPHPKAEVPRLGAGAAQVFHSFNLMGKSDKQPRANDSRSTGKTRSRLALELTSFRSKHLSPDEPTCDGQISIEVKTEVLPAAPSFRNAPSDVASKDADSEKG